MQDDRMFIIEVSVTTNSNEGLEARRAAKLSQYAPLMRQLDIIDKNAVSFKSVKFIPAIFGNCARVTPEFLQDLLRCFPDQQRRSRRPACKRLCKTISNELIVQAETLCSMQRLTPKITLS